MKKPRRSRTQILAMILAVGIAVAMLLGLILSILMSNAYGAASQSEIDRLKSKSKDLASQKAKLKDELASVRSEKDQAINYKAALDEQVRLLEEEIDNTTALIHEITSQISEIQLEYEGALEDERALLELYKNRLCVMERMGDADYWAVLSGADSLPELLTRIDMMEEIVGNDQKMLESLKETREKISDRQSELESMKSELSAEKKNLVLNQEELNEQYAEADNLILELMREEADFAKAYDEAEKQEKAAQAEVARMMEELKRKQSIYVGGEYIWPCPSSYRITSEFGYRLHPILNVYKGHSGIDIGAAKGSKALAANSGTVIISAYNSGYGNYVVIDHGGGQATLYAHLSKRSVSVNAKVSQGDTIGLVGSTGLSTGPHLHFEILINSKPVNPMDYFKKVS